MLKLAVSKNNGTPKSSILIGVSIIKHPFWETTIFGNIQIDSINIQENKRLLCHVSFSHLLATVQRRL